jgi:hypothetical protein
MYAVNAVGLHNDTLLWGEQKVGQRLTAMPELKRPGYKHLPG